nr:hypothetical protein [uncultured Allomuricauda sp.]
MQTPIHIPARLVLNLGAFQTFSMALYHFFIPYQFNWSQYLSEDIQTINWSLFATNNYFSFTLLLLSALMFYYFNSSNVKNIKPLIVAGFFFWLFSCLYQLIDPMPLPASLQWLRYLLLGIAVFNTSLFLISLKITKTLNA